MSETSTRPHSGAAEQAGRVVDALVARIHDGFGVGSPVRDLPDEVASGVWERLAAALDDAAREESSVDPRDPRWQALGDLCAVVDPGRVAFLVQAHHLTPGCEVLVDRALREVNVGHNAARLAARHPGGAYRATLQARHQHLVGPPGHRSDRGPLHGDPLTQRPHPIADALSCALDEASQHRTPGGSGVPYGQRMVTHVVDLMDPVDVAHLIWTAPRRWLGLLVQRETSSLRGGMAEVFYDSRTDLHRYRASVDAALAAVVASRVRDLFGGSEDNDRAQDRYRDSGSSRFVGVWTFAVPLNLSEREALVEVAEALSALYGWLLPRTAEAILDASLAAGDPMPRRRLAKAGALPTQMTARLASDRDRLVRRAITDRLAEIL